MQLKASGVDILTRVRNRWTVFLLIPLLGCNLAASSTVADDVLVEPNRVGKLTIGMPESGIYMIYPGDLTRKVDLRLEGFATPAVQVFLKKSHARPSLIIRLDGPAPGIYGIEVL